MDLISKLDDQGIALRVSGDALEFTMPGGQTKTVIMTDMENYLFLCMMNYVNAQPK